MNQAVRNVKPKESVIDKALATMDEDFKRAVKIANVPDIDIEADETQTRREAKFSAQFSLRFNYSTRTVRGHVNGNGVPHLSLSSATNRIDELSAELFKTQTSPQTLRERTLKGDFKDRTIHETDVAITTEHCSNCAGHGSFNCTPCGTHGTVRCTNCFFSGYVNCAACSGRGGTGNIPCTYCGMKGRVPCHICGGTAQAPCSSCGGHGTIGCGSCSSTGTISTIHSAKFTSTSKFTLKESQFSKQETGLVRIWAQGAFRGLKAADDGVEPWSDVATATVTRIGGGQDYSVDFTCRATVLRLDFAYDGEKAFAKYIILPISGTEFSPFLDKAVVRAGEVAAEATSPSETLKTLEAAGFERIAGYLREDPDEVKQKASLHSSGAISGKTLDYLVTNYKEKATTFSRSATRRAWKLPVTVAVGSWAAASYFGILDAVRQEVLIYPLAALSLAAGLVTMLSGSVEARWAIIGETGSVKGWKIGPAAIIIGLAAATMFWTTTVYGINL